MRFAVIAARSPLRTGTWVSGHRASRIGLWDDGARCASVRSLRWGSLGFDHRAL